MTATAHDFAVRDLERSLSCVPPAGEHARPLAELGRRVALALAELQVLNADEERDWSERFERSARPLVPAGVEIRARAREVLKRELADKRHAADDPLERRERFTDKLQALLEIGAVGWHEKSGWIERLDEAVPGAAARQPPPTYQGTELRAVAVGPAERLGGLRVISAELFEDLRSPSLAPDHRGRA